MRPAFGIIGAGRMGKIFARHLHHLGNAGSLLAVADPNRRRAEELQRQFNILYALENPEELLQIDRIDAVIITAPTRAHAHWIQRAAACGKHIFCEKPLSLDLKECDAALAAVTRAGVKLQVGFMRRFDAAYALAEKKIRAGAIGEPVLFCAVSRDPTRPSLRYARRESSGGLILDMGVHDFDLARWLMADEVRRVFAAGVCRVFPELARIGDIDNAVVTLEFCHGGLGTADFSRNARYGYDIRTEVLGSEGGVIIGGVERNAMLLLDRRGVVRDTYPFFMERFDEAYRNELQAFIDCLQEDRLPSPDGVDGRAATQIALAARQAAEVGAPVKVTDFAGG